MKYFELTFYITPYDEAASDVLAALLADAGCEAFESTDTGLKAYVQQAQFSDDAIRAAVEAMPMPVAISYEHTEAPDENWNATWEAEHQFLPVVLPNGCQLQILPRQAFGSGEHQTTQMMLQLLASLDLHGCNVIDAGCGTGILALAALKMGAHHVVAYDIDEWSIRNTADNFAANGLSADDTSVCRLLLGDARVLQDVPSADVVMANINLNILLKDLPSFASHLTSGGHLLLSGFLDNDTKPLTTHANELGLVLLTTLADREWRALLFQKK